MKSHDNIAGYWSNANKNASISARLRVGFEPDRLLDISSDRTALAGSKPPHRIGARINTGTHPMTADEMAELIVLWRFLVLPQDIVFDIIEANKVGEAFAPDPRGLKRIWKDMKRSQKEFLFEDYDRSNDEFSPERQAKLREVVDEAVEFDEHLYSRSYDEIVALYAECQIEQTAEDDQD